MKTAKLLHKLNFLHEIEGAEEDCAKDKISKVNAELQVISDSTEEGNLIRAKVHQFESAENSAAFYSRTEEVNGEKKFIDALAIGNVLSSDPPK
jgi:hypothetical protein